MKNLQTIIVAIGAKVAQGKSQYLTFSLIEGTVNSYLFDLSCSFF